MKLPILRPADCMQGTFARAQLLGATMDYNAPDANFLFRLGKIHILFYH